MPRLTFFLVCEKTLLTQDDLMSLIQVIENIDVAISPDTVLPPEARAPISWSIVSLWRKEPEEDGLVFEQRVDIAMPDGSEETINISRFEMEHERQGHRVVLTAFGFPVTAGLYRITLKVREADGEQDWLDVAEYPITVTHVTSHVETVL